MPTASPKVQISQTDGYAANFGEVLRSSAIFWVRNDDNTRTTISISNYWKFKNKTDVRVLVNVRDLEGRLVSREVANFAEADVVNFHAPEHFEGSVEVEAFGNRNLRIPYAAVMAIYETPDAISMVHSYARAYSQHEIEDQRTLSVGEESCWTLRDTAAITSFCVVHNGVGVQPAQSIRLRLRNADGAERAVEFHCPALTPFQTLKIEPRQFVADLVEWLDGRPGNGRISFNLNGGFTRMLCGVARRDGHQLQVTHSNFDYSTHQTDRIVDGLLTAYMNTPTVASDRRQEVVVYPDLDLGDYVLVDSLSERRFRSGTIVQREFATHEAQELAFSRDDRVLPTRIVTALRLHSVDATIPAECSLGVTHQGTPKKQFHWMTVSLKYRSTICWSDCAAIFGGCPVDAQMVFKLHTVKSSEPVVRACTYGDLPLDHTLSLAGLFDTQIDLGDDFAYLTVWCSYGGLTFYSTLEKAGSISIEHSF